MSIQDITPRMSKALRDGVRLIFFADLWITVVNAVIDTLDDFLASVVQTNMDFTTRPGFASLSLEEEYIQQLNYNNNPLVDQSMCASGSYSGYSYHSWESFLVRGGRWMGPLNIKVANTNRYATTGSLSIYDQTKTKLIATRPFNVPAGWAAPYPVHLIECDFTGVYLEAGNYWMAVHHTGDDYNSNFSVSYQKSNVFADGQYDYWFYSGGFKWFFNLGDIYFDMTLKKYAASGSFRSKRLDLLELPPAAGAFRMAYQLPTGCTMSVTLYGYTNITDTNPTVTIANAEDGQAIPAYRYWDLLVVMSANATRDRTPVLNMLEFIFPKVRVQLREKTRFQYADENEFRDFQALLRPLEFTVSEIKIMDRVSSGGDASAVLEDPTGEIIQRIIANSPLKNHQAELYIGADVPGLTQADLLRYFIGTIDDVDYVPRYRRDRAELHFTFKNALSALDVKVPVPTSTGQIDYSQVGINEDGTHVADAMLNAIRNHAAIPARWIRIDTYEAAKTTVGDGDPPAGAYIVRRSYAPGLPDTRIKSPVSLRDEILKPLSLISDGYTVIDESSRIAWVKHDKYAAAAAVWANERLVIDDGIAAVPIEDVAKIRMSYKDLLYNVAVLGCDWTGTSDDWTNFSTFANVHEQSTDDWAPGRERFLSILEKPMRAASRWLGPEDRYNGETLARALTRILTSRFAYPPVVMMGVVVPQSEFMRTIGSVVQVWDPEFAKFERKGIALSETLKFMILKKNLLRDRNRVSCDLLELT